MTLDVGHTGPDARVRTGPCDPGGAGPGDPGGAGHGDPGGDRGRKGLEQPADATDLGGGPADAWFDLRR